MTHRRISVPPVDIEIDIEVADLVAPGPGRLTLRGLERADRQAVEALVRATDLFTPAEKDVAMEVLDAYLAQPGRDYHALGAFLPDDHLVGFACYGPTACTRGTWDLYWIAAAADSRGHGVGTLLLEEVERRVAGRQGRMLVIETSSRTEYTPARAFYERRGYSPIARVPDFYAPGDDRLIFVRSLDHV